VEYWKNPECIVDRMIVKEKRSEIVHNFFTPSEAVISGRRGTLNYFPGKYGIII